MVPNQQMCHGMPMPLTSYMYFYLHQTNIQLSVYERASYHSGPLDPEHSGRPDPNVTIKYLTDPSSSLLYCTVINVIRYGVWGILSPVRGNKDQLTCEKQGKKLTE